MENQIALNESIADIQELQKKLAERHKNEPTFFLRINSVFDSLLNSLSATNGKLNIPNHNGFKPTPLGKVAGKEIEINQKSEKKESFEEFKSNVQKAYDSFIDRENTDLKDSLREDEIRGVAKLAEVENWEYAKIDGNFLNRIKKAIVSQKELDAAKEAAKQKELDAAKEVK